MRARRAIFHLYNSTSPAQRRHVFNASRDEIRRIATQGTAWVRQHAAPLVAACLEGLGGLDVDLLSPADPAALAGILAFRHPRAEAVHAALHARGIHVMHHAGRLRVAIHGYTTAADVEAFLSALATAA